jgi:hypothetical protein
MTYFPIKVFLFVAAIVLPAYSFADKCSDHLINSNYVHSSLFSSDRGDVKLTMKVEAGSIEAMHPGVIRRLIRIREAVQKQLGASKGDPLSEARNLAYERLEQLREDVYDRRLNDLVANSISVIEANGVQFGHGSVERSVQGILSTLWELTVACAFSGEEIFLNKTIAEIYPDRFRDVEARLQGRNFKLDREIDVAILSKDGSWRWIEVKDWSVLSNIMRKAQRKLLDQSRKQDAIRHALKLDIKMILLLKYGMSGQQLEDIRLNSRHDEIDFVFPGR